MFHMKHAYCFIYKIETRNLMALFFIQFVCQDCNKKFSRKDSYKRHVQGQHKKDKGYIATDNDETDSAEESAVPVPVPVPEPANSPAGSK